jgi:salicylate hydroxylase
VTVAGGSVVKADLVIAADGIHSLGTKTLLGKPTPAVPSNLDNFCYRFLIPTKSLAQDPATKKWTENDDGHIKFIVGKDKRIVWYPCRE